MGSYRDLAAEKEGAFAKLMEWQMSGGATAAPALPGRQGKDVDPELTEEERRELRLEEEERRRVEEGGYKARGASEGVVEGDGEVKETVRVGKGEGR